LKPSSSPIELQFHRKICTNEHAQFALKGEPEKIQHITNMKRQKFWKKNLITPVAEFDTEST